ncbi:MAG: pyridoxine 5'-phosphate synthase [Verrucomicrobia bacterium]|nr:MAG: pyridoxine 5'-phosphate synthase [Verrucomicrobiota bacterium]TAE86174.1 MAG: pyridoxine 5'-phosphate synthase [Verrucomicrobiota bacterium]TAF23521.1 MAG: pyridoxine 5'-phosphate synthase [Verrucomicrobiota bacterium]TAF40148.1 MAG: pyridoxine 5'-phosphate synthase [Verrucomicrobiota bacterium]
MGMLLGVNIDHVATLRQARYALLPDSPNAEPSPLQAALDARDGGGDSITIHVRGDRRHMQDRDAFEIREHCPLPLNLEMGVTAEMTRLALALMPDFVCLVPETREEVTTEGGLDVAGRLAEVQGCVETLRERGIRVSLFIDPDLHQIEAAAATGAEMVELHTGCFANALDGCWELEVDRLSGAARAGHSVGLQVNAGHGINYSNLLRLFTVPHLAELNIGHSIVARAMRIGFGPAVREMKDLMAAYPGA